MKLVTFQSLKAVKSLFEKGYLECDEKNINFKKDGTTYKWIVKKMNQGIDNPNMVKYPLWCWVKCYNGICPSKKKGQRVDGFDVKITFNKNEKDVFITDFRKYSFILKNMYIPNTLKEKHKFDEKLKKFNITKEELEAFVRLDKYKEHRTDKDYIDICKEINSTFDRCITKNSNILQGCIWRIDIDEIEKIEIIKDDGYIYGSLNYVRSNGKRIDWQKDYYKTLK